jgi:hypothetical protein
MWWGNYWFILVFVYLRYWRGGCCGKNGDVIFQDWWVFCLSIVSVDPGEQFRFGHVFCITISVQDTEENVLDRIVWLWPDYSLHLTRKVTN